jgi:Zn-dependent protease
MAELLGVWGLGILAMLLHEVGHLLAALAMGVKVKRVCMHWRGLCIVREAGTPVQNLAVTMAGPLTNLLLMLVPSTPFRLANLLLLIVNLAPVRNSDGDRILSCVWQLRRQGTEGARERVWG